MARAVKKRTAARTGLDARHRAFGPVIRAFSKDRRVTPGGRFGAVSLRSDGAVFAMFFKGKFVAKLPAERVARLVAAGKARRFDPGHGRAMKEWVELSGNPGSWIGLAREARRYVDTVRSAPRARNRK